MIEKWPGIGNKRRRSQGMVEFALALPIVLILMFGIIEFGRFIYTFASVFSASREAARVGSSVDIGPDGVPHYLDCAEMREAARRLGSFAWVSDADIDIRYDRGVYETAPFSSLDRRCTSSGPVFFSTNTPLTESDISMGDRVVVQVTRVFQPLVPFVGIRNVPVSQITPRLIVKRVEVAGTSVLPGTPTRTPTNTLTPSLTPTVTSTPTRTPTITGTPFTPTPTSTSTQTIEPTVNPNSCKSTPSANNYCTSTPTPTITYTPSITPSPTPDCSYVQLGSLIYSQYGSVIEIDIANTSSDSSKIATLQSFTIEFAPSSGTLTEIDFGLHLPNTPVPTPNRTVSPTETSVPTLTPITNMIWSGSINGGGGGTFSGLNTTLKPGGGWKPLYFLFAQSGITINSLYITTIDTNQLRCTVGF